MINLIVTIVLLAVAWVLARPIHEEVSYFLGVRRLRHTERGLRKRALSQPVSLTGTGL